MVMTTNNNDTEVTPTPTPTVINPDWYPAACSFSHYAPLRAFWRAEARRWRVLNEGRLAKRCQALAEANDPRRDEAFRGFTPTPEFWKYAREHYPAAFAGFEAEARQTHRCHSRSCPCLAANIDTVADALDLSLA